MTNRELNLEAARKIYERVSSKTDDRLSKEFGEDWEDENVDIDLDFLVRASEEEFAILSAEFKVLGLTVDEVEKSMEEMSLNGMPKV
jgi:hypothetical protein